MPADPRDPVEVVAGELEDVAGGCRLAIQISRFVLSALHEAGWRIVLPAERDDHFVAFDGEGWQIEHSAECRNAGQMLRGCTVHRELSAWCPGVPVAGEGRYRVMFDDPEPTPSFYERPPTPRLAHTFGLYPVHPYEPRPEALLITAEWTPKEADRG